MRGFKKKDKPKPWTTPEKKREKETSWKATRKEKRSRKRARRKWRVPGLRMVKRILAAALCAVNFILSQLSLAAGVDNWFFAVFLLASAYIMFDYVWKTRRPKEVFTPREIGKPIFIALLKKIRAKDTAITHLTPAYFNAKGACSRLDPHPKFFPATITTPS